MPTSITIALDIMSGDNGPSPALTGAFKSLDLLDDLKIILVGDESLIEDKIAPANKNRIEIVHTDEFIKMDDDLVHAIRNKKKSSMRLAVNCVKESKAQACVSAGNTGALMSISKIILKTIEGIDRPAICTSLPTKKNFMQMLDLGANIECSAQNLFQFAVMGASVVCLLYTSPSPRDATLSRMPSSA